MTFTQPNAVIRDYPHSIGSEVPANGKESCMPGDSENGVFQVQRGFRFQCSPVEVFLRRAASVASLHADYIVIIKNRYCNGLWKPHGVS